MSHKVTIIGAGSVGSTIAYTMVTRGLSSEICLIDINNEKAKGEAMDIAQGTPYCSPVNIYAGDYPDAKDSNIVIITSGIARKPGQSRLELAQINVNILKSITENIVKYAPDAIYIIVSNPVDVMTYAFAKFSGLPENQIIGSGTLLDTARLRAKIADNYSINPQNVHALVLGEHGDSSFVPWSVSTISNVPFEKYWDSVKYRDERSSSFDYDEMIDFVRKSGGVIIERKGATFYAVATCVCHICSCIFGDMQTALPVSTMHHGEYGIDDVCISTLAVIDDTGVSGKVILPLTEDEIAKLQASAAKLKEVIGSITI
ncbi:MAG: L-lactate dehydrogenase [Clostridia bacterium]|nr:L-lactate dehydrogenase [Clostridia bacterium]